MATSSTQPQDDNNNNNNNKPVTGYPAQPMTGYPSTAGTGIAYPYPAAAAAAGPPPGPPPPPNPYYQTYQTYQTYQPPVGPTYYYGAQSNGPRILRRLLMGFIILFSIMGLIFFISWLILKPHLPEFRVNSASVSQLNATLSQLSATWAFTLFVNNPNHKLSISYDRLEAYVFYNEDTRLGVTELAPFKQGKRNETTLRFEVGIVNEYVSEGIVKSINVERGSGSVDFEVKVVALVRFRAGIWRMRQHIMQVFCNPIKFSFPNTNNTNTNTNTNTNGTNGTNGTGTLLLQSNPNPCQVYL